MFYTEEDLTPAVNQAVSILGRNGVRRVGKNIQPNVSVATRALGKIWYGDVDTTTLDTSCVLLSERLTQPVYLFYQDTDFDFDSTRVFFKED